MKKATSTKRWLWLVTVVAILVAMACMFTACGGNEEEQTQPTEIIPTDLYWNLDKALYTENSDVGLSTRERGDDGLYHFRFVTGGKLVELTTGDAQIVNYIDTMEVVGLILDADGNIADAVPVAEFATEVAKEFFVKKVKGNNVQLNSSPLMNGMDVDIVVPDGAHIVDVRRDTETPGEKIELDVMDSVWVYADMDNNITDVYLSKRPPQSEFYLRLNRFYSSGKTTRTPDKDGVYTIPFAVNGEQVELKCKDEALVSKIDSGTDAGQHMGLVFDEEGYIIDMMSGSEALRGVAVAMVFDVKEINGNQVTFVGRLPVSSQGNEVTVNLTENTKIINSEMAYKGNQCWEIDFAGQYLDSLKLDDRVICYADSDNNALVIDVLVRRVESNLYYNMTRKYDSTKKETTRTPDADGYYVFQMATEGKLKTLKTKSKAIASMVDSYDPSYMGLKLSGSIIKGVCNTHCCVGFNSTAKLIAREILGNVVTLTSRWDIGNVGGNYVIADGCKIFNVTGDYGVAFGSKTTVKPGDHCYGVKNSYGELAYIYVTKRVASGTKLYYNTWRRFNTTTNQTTRPADAQGYYVYDLLTETGKLIQAKTDKKEMADFIDLQLSPFVALKINSEGIITKAAFCESALEWGMKYTNYHYIRSIDYNTMTYNTYYMSGDKQIDSYTNVPIASNVKMYNFSTNYKEYRGEKTKVRVDDRIQAFYDAGQNKVSHIYVLERYDPAVKKYCPHCDKKVTFYGYKNGTAPAGETTHYYIANDRYLSQLAVGATKVDSNPDNKRTTVVLDLNGKVLNGSSSRAALVYGDMIVFDSKGGGGVTGNLAGMGGAFLVRETGTLTLVSGTYTFSADPKYKSATMGGVVCLYEDTTLNIEKDAVLTGGRCSGSGGLINAYGNAVINVNGGTIKGGETAVNGGNIVLAGNATFNMPSGKLLSGTAGGLGNNVYISGNGVKFNLGADVECDGGIAFYGDITYPITGKVDWPAENPVVLRNGAKLDLTAMDPASKLTVDAEGVFTTDFETPEKAAEYLGCFGVPENYKPVSVEGKALSTELDLSQVIAAEKEAAAAIAAKNPAEVVAGTTCPMCGAENVTWVKHTGEMIKATTNMHIYFEGAMGTAEEPLVADLLAYGDNTGKTICIALVDADVNTTARFLVRTNETINVMGKGKIHSNGVGLGNDCDYGLFTVMSSGAKLNLYGGNYTYSGTGFGKTSAGEAATTTPMYGLLAVTNNGATVNIYNDVTIGNPEKDDTRAYYNVYTVGTVNMYGGTIQNGVSRHGSIGGNVTIGAKGVLNMYGGTIKGGETTFRGGNVLMLSNSTLNMWHKDALITEGKAVAVANQNSGGGNIGTVDYIANASINMYDGTISNGIAGSAADFKGGGNIFGYGWSETDPATFKINIMGGTVTGGKGPIGGNIYARNHTAVTIGKDAVISNGTATLRGGNIELFNQARLTTEGTIIGGTAPAGGNINANGHKTAGTTYVTVNGGTIANGTTTGATAWGGNIRGWNSQIVINDGYIYGGSSVDGAYHKGAANIGSMGDSGTKFMPTLYINGGHIAGDIRTYAHSDGTCITDVKLSGSPEIAWTITLPDGTSANATVHGLFFQSGVKADVSGLKPEAKILVSAGENAVISVASENAAAVAGCFTTTNTALKVEATAENVLKLVKPAS